MPATWKKLAFNDEVIRHDLATAANDFLVASGAGAFVKQTLAETKTVLGITDAATIDPGHKHSKLWASDGSPEAVTVDAAGNVGIGTTEMNSPLVVGASPAGEPGYPNGVEVYQAGYNVSTPNGSFNKAGNLVLSGAGNRTAGTGGMLGFAAADDTGQAKAIYLSAAILGVAENSIMGNADGALTFHTTRFSSGWITDEKVRITSIGNVGIGIAAFGTSAAKVLGLASGTAPTTAPADMAQLWVQDIITPGYAGLHKRTETTNQVEIVPGVIYKATTGSPANPYEGLMEINTFDNKINMYADAGWRELATW